MTRDTDRETCKICRDARATHLCQGCGELLCLECQGTRSSVFYVCNECHHVLGTPQPGESFEKCPECDSDDLGEGKRVENICPRCHSTETIVLEEKRRTLTMNMRHAIQSLSYGHTKLREFQSRFTSAKRLLVSLRMANFLHYHWLESKIEDMQEEIPAVKTRIASQAEIVAKQIAAETKGLMDYNDWEPSQFPFIEGVTNRVNELGKQYRRNVDESLQRILLKIEELEKQLDGLNYYRNEFSDFYEYAELSVNELPVCAFPDVKLTGSDFIKADKSTGTLFITNKRVVFIAETGIVRKKTDIVFDYPLIYLNSIGEDGRIRKRVVLKFKQGEVKITCCEQTERVLPDYIEIARKFDKYIQTDLQRVRKLEQGDLNISEVRMKIENLVYSLLAPTRAMRDTKQSERRSSEYTRPWDTGRIVNPSGYDRQPRRNFRDHLEGTISRGSQDATQYRRNPEIRGLERELHNLENAMRNMVHLFRDGRMVPEEFIRRYKSLMRDSFFTKKRISDITRETQDFRW
ncbi:MAG: hypothetical protein BAJATHORv1_10428 [Candidatus Thorarchaeota archaeon]|nr:MAG: hypothetical protein BAJATHORv1_10428 [Candidatus Thorarchaeota archaeon]